ncbi:MAG: right-handed parallel beta-helix repeat-containing protein [Bacteroidota bacterium]
MRPQSIILFLFSLSVIFLLWQCSPIEEKVRTGAVDLVFSTDTLRFDTIFTELGSATRSIKVYNRYKERIRISKISITGEMGGKFRMNVDGIPGNEVRDIEIEANDSLYIFCEVTVDPDQPLSESPFIIESSIRFETNEGEQEVLLEAWGQNANYIPSRFGKGTLNLLSGEAIWDDPKPYVIYGWLFVDNGVLTIPAGARIYIHGGLVRNDELGVYNDGRLWILDNGRLKIEGTAENPVIIEGDRLEEAFEGEAGQWYGIYIGQNSKGNTIEHTTIRNSFFGVYVDSAATLTVRNTQFYNTSSTALVGEHARMDLQNCLIYNNGGNSVQMIHGGDYNLDHCTVASFGVDAAALALSNFICYVPANLGCELGGVYRLNANFRNSIFFGSKDNEIILTDAIQDGRAGFNYNFENCIVRVNEDLLEDYPDFYDYCTNCPQDVNRSTPLFLDVNEDDYRLDSLSIAIGAGIPIDNVRLDLEGNQRDENAPDIGCFERID